MGSVPPDDMSFPQGLVDFAGSELFMRTFEEGMAMVEETASYLDGAGRQESRDLPRAAALAYAGESMRLTTRLMQVASWLLVQRSVFDGEMERVDAASDKYRLGSKEICRGTAMEGSDQLPVRLRDLLARSERLYDRVERLDDLIYQRTTQPETGIGPQLRTLQRVFGREDD